MKIIIHRGTHQIGGVATEISTENMNIPVNAVPMPQAQPAEQPIQE